MQNIRSPRLIKRRRRIRKLLIPLTIISWVGSARIKIEAKGTLKDHGLAEKPSPGAKAQKAAEPQEPEHQGTLAPPMPHGP